MTIRSAVSTARRLEQLGTRLLQQRLNQDLTQSELAAASGLSLRTIARAENGEPIQLDSFVRILSALGLDKGWDGLVPEVPESPILQLDRASKRRRRASGRRRRAGRRGSNRRSAGAPGDAWAWAE